jgi:hypothetical protein
MRYFLYSIIGTVYTASFLVSGSFALAQFNPDEAIDSFDARVTVSEDGTIEVVERIVYDFGEQERHGIFRVIPYSYQAGTETYTAAISGVLVTDGLGAPLPFNESRDSGELTLKIGDPNRKISGKNTYVINYYVDGPFLFFEDKDELYWNVTGSWPTGIARATVLVDLPKGAPVLSASCYAGKAGARDRCASDQRLQNSRRVFSERDDTTTGAAVERKTGVHTPTILAVRYTGCRTVCNVVALVYTRSGSETQENHCDRVYSTR